MHAALPSLRRVAVAGLVVSAATRPMPAREVMIWVYCHTNHTTGNDGWGTARNWLVQNRAVYTKLAAQTYFVDPSSSTGNLGVVARTNRFLKSFQRSGVKTVAWVSPTWTNQSLAWRPANRTQVEANLEIVLNSPGQFIAALKADAVKNGHSAVNFDFEQYYGNATVDPGMKHGHTMRQKYVELLTLAAKEMGSVGVDVSADLGSDPSNYLHSPLAPFAAVPLRPAITMATYNLKFVKGGGPYHDFDANLNAVVARFGPQNAGAGLCNCNNDADGVHGQVNATMLDRAFASIKQSGVRELDWFALVARGDQLQVGPQQMGGQHFLQHLKDFLGSRSSNISRLAIDS